MNEDCKTVARQSKTAQDSWKKSKIQPNTAKRQVKQDRDKQSKIETGKIRVNKSDEY